MKKVLSIACVFLLVLSLAACGGKKADGVYTAQVDATFAADVNHGWTDTLTVTYKDGKVVAATYEAYDADGNKKSEDVAYGENMGMDPAIWMPQLALNVITAGTADKVEGVAGATNASDNVKALFAAIEKDGKANETITVTMPVAA